MRCPYCGKRLPLLRRLQSAEFCSESHRQLFHEETDQVALERLVSFQSGYAPYPAEGMFPGVESAPGPIEELPLADPEPEVAAPPAIEDLLARLSEIAPPVEEPAVLPLPPPPPPPPATPAGGSRRKIRLKNTREKQVRLCGFVGVGRVAQVAVGSDGWKAPGKPRAAGPLAAGAVAWPERLGCEPWSGDPGLGRAEGVEFGVAPGPQAGTIRYRAISLRRWPPAVRRWNPGTGFQVDPAGSVLAGEPLPAPPPPPRCETLLSLGAPGTAAVWSGRMPLRPPKRWPVVMDGFVPSVGGIDVSGSVFGGAPMPPLPLRPEGRLAGPARWEVSLPAADSRAGMHELAPVAAAPPLPVILAHPAEARPLGTGRGLLSRLQGECPVEPVLRVRKPAPRHRRVQPMWVLRADSIRYPGPFQTARGAGSLPAVLQRPMPLPFAAAEWRTERTELPAAEWPQAAEAEVMAPLSWRPVGGCPALRWAEALPLAGPGQVAGEFHVMASPDGEGWETPALNPGLPEWRARRYTAGVPGTLLDLALEPCAPKVSPAQADGRAEVCLDAAVSVPELGLSPKTSRQGIRLMPIAPGAAMCGERQPKATIELAIPSRRPEIPRARLKVEAERVKPGGPAASLLRPRSPEALSHMARIWGTAPADLKWIAMVVPVVLIAMLYSAISSRPITPSTIAPAQERKSGAWANLRNTMADQMDGVRRTVSQRAGVEFVDNFHNGLSEWQGRSSEWAKSWSYDPSGGVRTGQLAVYKPTVRLADYSLQFLGQIDKKALSWAVRASDLDNYYALKLVLTKNGPMPSAAIIRYRVVDGKEGPHVQLPLPLPVHGDTLYRVGMQVEGSQYSVTVQGQLVDSWTDSTFKSGGVGFFSGKGELGSLRWVQVSYQYDMLGRLCAYLAPYQMEGSGSWKP